MLMPILHILLFTIIFTAMTYENKRLKLCKVRSIIAITLSLSNIRAIQAPCKYLFDAWVLFQFQSAFVPLVFVLKVAEFELY